MSRPGAVVAFLLAVAGLHAQPTPAAPPEDPSEIRLTTTVISGDRGGKIFGKTPEPAKTRHYYIAAEAEQWDYAPSGRDEVFGRPLPPNVAAERKASKVRYVRYTDATFRARVFPTPGLGVLGPVLRGVVGEYLAITFLNRSGQPLSMHPHGVHYDKDNEGSYDRLSPGLGAAVGPGATFTYIWELDAKSGPLATEPSSKGWLYHSHVQGDDETNLGLAGFIIVTDPARARADGTPADVDREFGALFMVFDESGLGEDVKEAAEYANLPGAASAPKTWTEVQELLAQGTRPSINGRSFGNLAGLEMNEGERVRWYLFSLGDEHDFHTVQWHDLRVVEGGRRTDTVELLPASMKVADLVADTPGAWLLQCHVSEHERQGMTARFVIHPRNGGSDADRTPAIAFLGLPAAAQSLRIVRAESGPGELALSGEATIFEAFSVFNQAFELQLGGRAVTFRPDANGSATAADGSTLRVTNAGSVGVVYGGLLRFEIVLRGAGWPSASAAETILPLTLRLGVAEHHANARLIPRPAKAP